MLAVGIEAPNQPEVVELLEAGEAYALALYPSDGCYMLNLGELEAPGVTVFVARLQGEAVGTAALVNRDDGSAELKRMFVHEAARGRGVGAAVLAAATIGLSAGIAGAVGQVQLDAVPVDGHQGGALDGYDMAARYLPSVATQHARQQALPSPGALRDSLDAALADSPFRGDAFEDFLADVATARAAPPLQPGDLNGTPLASTVEGLLLGGEGRATALVSLSGLHDVEAVARVAADHGARLLQPEAIAGALHQIAGDDQQVHLELG